MSRGDTTPVSGGPRHRPPGRLRRWREPGGVGRQLLAAVGWSSVLQLISRAQSAVLLAAAARLLALEELGTFFAIQAIGLLGSGLWDLGSTVLITRDVAAGSAPARSMVGAALRQRLVTAPVFLVVVGAVTWALSGQAGFPVAVSLLILAAPTVVGIGTIYNAVLLGRRDFSASATAVTAGRVVSVGLLAILLVLGPTGATAALCLAAALLVGELITFGLQWRSAAVGSGPVEADHEHIPTGAFIRKSVPHAANSVFNFAYQKGDILIVTALAGVVATAQYTPASQLQNILTLIPTLLAAGIVPVVSSDHASGEVAELAARVGRRIAQVGVVLSIPLCIVATLFMTTIIGIVIGSTDAAYVVPALIVVWALPFMCAHTPLTDVLIARGLAPLTTRAYAVAFTGSLALQIALVPVHGAVGAAIAGVARDVLMLVAILAVMRWGRRPAGRERV